MNSFDRLMLLLIALLLCWHIHESGEHAKAPIKISVPAKAASA